VSGWPQSDAGGGEEPADELPVASGVCRAVVRVGGGEFLLELLVFRPQLRVGS
jgi:hypothetical protein